MLDKVLVGLTCPIFKFLKSFCLLELVGLAGLKHCERSIFDVSKLIGDKPKSFAFLKAGKGDKTLATSASLWIS